MTMTTVGLDSLVADLDKAGLTIGLRASRVVIDTANQIEDTQRRTVQRRSGATARSVNSVDDSGGPLTLGDLTAEIGPDDWKAHLLEYGTKRARPFPFVGTSLDPHRAGYIAAMARIAGDI